MFNFLGLYDRLKWGGKKISKALDAYEDLERKFKKVMIIGSAISQIPKLL